MRGWTVYFVALLFAMQAVPLVTQERAAQAREKPKPTFALSIEVDNDAARSIPDLHRLLVKFTHISIGVEVEQFHQEAEGMYEMVVLRDGLPAKETDAMRELRRYRKRDGYPTIRNPRLLRTGESWITPLDVSDYYDMSKPGIYQIHVTRESQPGNPAFSTTVSSNTVTVVVPQITGSPTVHAVEKPKPRFALTISKEDPEDVRPDWLQVDMQNISKGAIRELKCWPFYGMYNYRVFRNGEQLKVSDELQSLQKSRAGVDCPGNETLLEVEPGVIYGDRVPLRNYFDIDEPGSYVVYVTRETYPFSPAKSVLVESNALSFVVPEPTPAGKTQPPDEAQPTNDRVPTQ